MRMARNPARLMAIGLTLGGLTGCGSLSPTPTLSPAPSSSPTGAAPSPVTKLPKPKVVATNSVLCDLTQELAADTVDLTCLIQPGTDPHVYQATAADRKAIETANLVLYSGYDFEPEITKLIKASSSPAPKVAVSEVAVPTPQNFEEDGKTEPDPHVWHNAQHGGRMAAVIGSSLTKVAPSNGELYAKRVQGLTTDLTRLDSWIKNQIATIPTPVRKLVTTHSALGYYASAYSIPVEGALQGVSTEEKPTAARVKSLVDEIRKTQVPTIFAEVSTNSKLLETVAQEAKVKIADRELYTDGLGAKGSPGETYRKMLIANTQTIVEGLGGKFTSFALAKSEQTLLTATTSHF
jgi:manganese/iron transport system substrate-binding protein